MGVNLGVSGPGLYFLHLGSILSPTAFGSSRRILTTAGRKKIGTKSADDMKRATILALLPLKKGDGVISSFDIAQ